MSTVQFTGEPELEKSTAIEDMTSKRGESGSCMRCKQADSTMASDPCRCYKVCNKCAMKMATGGKCKMCKNMFVSFRGLTAAERALATTTSSTEH